MEEEHAVATRSAYRSFARTASAAWCLLAAALSALSAVPVAGDLQVAAVMPAARSMTCSTHDPVAIEFDQPVDPASVTPDSLRVFGRWSGTATGTFAFSPDGRTVTLTRDFPFISGELVLVTLSRDIESQTGENLRDAGHSFTFTVRATRGGMSFPLWQEFSTNRQGESSIPYGGFASDLNHDGWPDLSIVNEDTDDLRIFMNTADGEATFADFAQPTTPLGQVPSPSDPADFNNDGHSDVVIANTVGSSVSILLGNGDGTFAPQQMIGIGGAARGLAVFDFDGDGDTDIAATSASSSRVALLFNDGAGVFGAPVFFEGGANEEWALGSGDMNEDGILDLIVGARAGQRIVIHLGDGDGTFTQAASVASGGRTWVINIADVNNDGHEDVLCANSLSDMGSVLLGDGAGGLGPATLYPADPFPLSTDAGDLDGDGDVDWVISSYSGDWWVYTNDGDGTFTFNQELPAAIAASCSLLVDIDLDGDLDITMVDEIADELIIRKNGVTARDAAITAVAVTRGQALTGVDAPTIEHADRIEAHVRSGFGSTFIELHSMVMDVAAVTDVANPDVIDVLVEARINQPAGTARVALRRRADGAFVTVAQGAVGPTRGMVAASGIDASPYVGTSGEIDLRLTHLVFVPIFAFRFESFVDHVEVVVE